MKEQKKYIERDDLKDATHLEVSVYYSLGGANFLSGGTTPRGYYLSVNPVTKSTGIISYTLFTRSARLLFETQRFTAKQFERAVEMAKDYEDELIAVVVNQNKANTA